MDKTYVYGGIIIFALINIFLRALPFMVFGGKDLPKSVDYLSDRLPAAIMAILVIYNLRSTVFTQAPYALPEIISVILTVIIHYWKENTILTLISGTATYIILLNLMG